MARLLRSSAVVGMLVPLSSTLAAAQDGSAARVLRQTITQEDMDDVASYFGSLIGRGMPEGGGAARLFLVAVPPGGGRGSPLTDPEQPGTACAARPPTEEEKRSFQYMKFELQRKLFAASSRNGHLTLMQLIAEAESSLNESKSQELSHSSEVHERRVAEDKKLDQILTILLEDKRSSSASGRSSEKADPKDGIETDKKVEQILMILLEDKKSSSANCGSSEKADPKDGNQTAGKEWNLDTCSSEKVTCKVYHFIVRDGKRYMLTVGRYASKVDKHLTSGIKYYLLALPVIVWLSMGLSFGEIGDLLMLRHKKMSKEAKQEVLEYRMVQADEKEAEEKGITVEDLLELRNIAAAEAEMKKAADAAADAAEAQRKKEAAEAAEPEKKAAETAGTVNKGAAGTGTKGFLGWLKPW